MFRKIVLITSLIFLLVMLAGFLLPAQFSAERSTTIDASEDIVFDTLATITTWPRWNPWLEGGKDDGQITFGDTLQGEGSVVYMNKGESDVSKIRIVSVAPVRKEIDVQLQIAGQFNLAATIVVRQSNYGTLIEWREKGELGMNPVQRYIALAMPALLGKTIDQGLTNLKQILEEGSVEKTPSQ